MVLLTAFLLTSCDNVKLYQKLSEEDANEILVLLSENGIKANKEEEVVQNETFYAISVKEADMAKARSLLVQHNLPRRRELGLTGVYKEKGLIPTPDEQKARYILALKGEIINSLRRIPQVIDADVVLNLPQRDEFASAEEQHRQRPTASVVVKVKPDPTGESPLTESKIQQFVANGIEGMNPRDVAVVITYLPVKGFKRSGDVMTMPETGRPSVGSPQVGGPPPAVEYKLIGLNLDAESKDKLKIYLLLFFVVLIVLSAALIVVIIQGARMRRTLAALQGPAGEHPAIEGQLMDEGGPPQLGQPPEEDEF